MNQGTKNQTGIDLVGWIRDNWVWAAPLLYIYVTIVGMVQSWLQFNAFGINVFEYSELNDFLLAAFREPLSFMAILGLIAYGGIGILAYWMMEQIYRRRKWPPKRIKQSLRMVKWMMYSFFVILVLIAPYAGPSIIHQGFGQEWKNRFTSEADRNVRVLMRGLEKDVKENAWIENLTLIGTTDKFIFFFEESSNDVLIAPLSNVVLIRKSRSV